MPMNDHRNEDGFTMIVTMIGLSLIAVLVLVGVTAVNGDSHLSARGYGKNRAYEAAKAGIDEYAYHLHINNGYWAECTKVPTPNAVNQINSTANRRAVPGETGASYAIELIPATGQTTCDPTNIVTATKSMLESLGTSKGTFRIRSTGYSGNDKVSIMATFKPASFLDYVYFTQLETSDPVTYGSKSLIEGAYKQCAKTIAAGRTEAEVVSGSGVYCKVISFVEGDKINGPLHTNDAIVVCNNPTFGRNASDAIEVSSGLPGWFSTNTKSLHSGSSCSGKPNFVGTYRTNSPILLPPSTNSQLATVAEPAFRYKGQVRICLSGASMVVNSGNSCNEEGKVLYSGPIPSNGVVYVSSGVCSNAYTPFELIYPTGPSECGNVYVQGTYTGQLTIAAANDIIINGNLIKSSEEGILGLIANNFIRVYHPLVVVPATKTEPEKTECKNSPSTPKNMTIDAAILAIEHSFIVDNYDCGESLGELTVHGAISQKYRGAVGTTSGTGYIKNYNYDDRLHTIAPPSFIQPVQADWVIGRETVG
jgi:Tfp pilus assembly protein PilE